MIIDTSKVLKEDAVNNNVELTESFEVFFPDGTSSSLTGGQKTMEEYRDMIRAQKCHVLILLYDVIFRKKL